ncbi:NAD-dependent epimerase/dehydratase family protein [Candidatus Oscillochloris fontis]|uniref:NAD-dependent epimerase/dehydratase family protein n=1 Tax=Candidatus Oscillochloris fontis TaxID=2496868 RepID=UPI0013755033|nr:NAD-dependent epimerase/dehydratase family protein [Candidatus Oscillochloris fontis]
MKIIITGGAGFIGSHLVDRLVRDQAGELIVIDSMLRGRPANLAQHRDNPLVQVVTADIRDAETMRSLCAGAELIYHLAAQSNVMGAVSDLNYSFSTNVAGTVNVLEAARLNGVRRVVFTSSREVYGDVEELPVREEAPFNAKNAYGASKAAGELYARVFHNTYGVETAVVRLANVYGSRDYDRVIPLWLSAAAQGEPMIVYGGQQVIDFVYVDQVVEALIRASSAAIIGQPINIGSGQGTPLLQLAERVLALPGAKTHLDLHPARSVEVARFTADISRMRNLLGLEVPSDPLFALEDLWANQH